MKDYGQCNAVTARGYRCAAHSTGWLVRGHHVCTFHKSREADGFKVWLVSECERDDARAQDILVREHEAIRA